MDEYFVSHSERILVGSGTNNEAAMQELHKHLPNLYLFRLVAQQGSFQAAANVLSLPRSSVSKKIQQLEDDLQLRLLQRSTRKLSLTENGLALLQATESLKEVLNNTQQMLSKRQQQAVGRVKISCSTVIGEKFLLPLISELTQTYPQISLDLNLTDNVVDLIADKVDIAVRVGQLPDSSLIARKIGQKSWAWYASPSYLNKFGTPSTPQELDKHACLIFKNAHICLNHWQFVDKQGEIINYQVKQNVTVDDGRTLVQLACLGQGVLMVDPLLIQPEIAAGKLVAIFTDYHHPNTMPIHLVCLGKQARSKAVDEVWRVLNDRMPELLQVAVV